MVLPDSHPECTMPFVTGNKKYSQTKTALVWLLKQISASNF
jgi:hypothetical protein